MTVSIDVYSSPTYDIIEGKRKVGGPGYYIALAAQQVKDEGLRLRLIGCGSLPKEYINLFNETMMEGDGANVFEHNIGSRAYRALNLTASCRGLPLQTLGGDIAIVSPTYWDIPLTALCKIVPSYRVVVVDVQGYIRPFLREHHDPLPVLYHIDECTRAGNTIVRASLDDIPLTAMVNDKYTFLTDIITWNGKAIAVKHNGTVRILRIGRPLESYALGAGDVYDLFLALMSYYGLPVVDAALAAHILTVKFLKGESIEVRKVLREVEAGIHNLRAVNYHVNSFIQALVRELGGNYAD